MALTNLNAAVAWTLQSVNTAQNGRFHIGAFIPSAAATTGLTAWRDGVIVSTNQGGSNNIPNDLQIKASGSPSLVLTVEAGHCVITRAGQGPYLCYNQTQGNVTLAAADPTNPRIDRIVAQVYDSALSDTLPTTPVLAAPGGLVIRAVTGTPAGSPSAPATPTGAISLATVSVIANDTTITNADITDTRKSAGNPGGARPLLPGDLSADAGTVAGDLRYLSTAAANGGVSVWTGGRWRSTGIPQFATPAARDAEITSPQIGEWAFTTDLQELWVYTSTGWIAREDQLVQYGRRFTTSSNSTSSTSIGVLRLDGNPLVQNHMVQLSYVCHPDSTVTTDNFRVELRYSTAGAAGVGDTIVFNSRTFAPVSAGARTWTTQFFPPSTGTYSFLLCIAREAGSGTCNLFADANRGTDLEIRRSRTDVGNTAINV